MFTKWQIEIIEDIVINKIIYPLHLLKVAYHDGIITDKQLEISIEHLNALYDWVYSLRR